MMNYKRACDHHNRTLKGCASVLAALFLVAAVLAAPARAQTKIVPVGNSITQADDQHDSYRRDLWWLLKNDGYQVDFVGSRSTNFGGPPPNPDFDLDHEGHWGLRADEILAGLPTWMAGYTADVALIHAGTNDVLQGQSTASTVADLEGIIDALRDGSSGGNPDVVILLAKLIPSNTNDMSALNAEMNEIAERKSTIASPVVVVDQSTGFNVSQDSDDGLHPNASGEAKMAQVWYDALVPFLDGPPQPASHYRLDETSGSTAADEQNVNPGTFLGSPVLGAAPVAPGSVGAIGVDGNDGVDLGSFDPGHQMTLTAWVNWDGAGTYQNLFSKRTPDAAGEPGGTSFRFMYYVDAGSSRLKFWDDSGPVDLGFDLTPGLPTHLALVLESGAMKLYANGVLKTTARAADLGAGTGAPFAIGIIKGAGLGFNGSIDEVRVYPTPLTAAEVSAEWSLDEGPPVVVLGPIPTGVEEGQPLTIPFAATDGGGPVSSLDALLDPTGMALAGTITDLGGGNYEATWSSAPAAGTYAVEVTATGEKGLTATASGSVSIVEAGLPASLLAHYKLDETSGSTASDETGAHPGSFLGSPVLGAPAVREDGGTAVVVDGNDGVDMGTFDPGTQMTLSAWVRWTGPGSYQNVFAKRAAGAAGEPGNADFRFMYFVDNASSRLKFWDDSGIVDLGHDLTAGAATHLVLVLEGGATKLYVDGSLVTTARAADLGAGATAPFSIGVIKNLGFGFNGAIDDAKVYAGAMTAAEVQAEFDGEAPDVVIGTIPSGVEEGEALVVPFTAVDAGGTIASTSAVLDPSGLALAATVTDLGGGNYEAIWPSAPPAGIYTIEVTATNDAGVGTIVSAEVRISAEQAPTTASFQDEVYPSASYAGTRDTKIKSTSVGTNYGASSDLQVDGSPDHATLLRWDLSSLPSQAEIAGASIRLRLFNATTDTYHVYEMLRPWREMEANWNEFALGSPWDDPGAQGASDRGSSVLGTIEASSTGEVVITLNDAGLAVLQQWIEAPSTNTGFVLMNYDGASDGIDFYSREYEDAELRPRLDVTYSPPLSGTPTAAFTATPTTGTNPLTVDFDASASSDDGQIVTYAWDFGDGGSGSGAITSHTYAAPGLHHATLTITDDEGLSDVAAVAIDVADSQQPVVEAFQDGLYPTSSYSGTRDVKIKSGSEHTNFGASSDLEADGSPDYASLLRWDLSSLPAQSEVVGASIRLSLFNSSVDAYFVYEMLRPWREMEATWNEFALASPWESAGAQGAADRGSTVLGTIEASRTGDFVIALNEAGLAVVQRWIENPATNTGFVLMNYDGASDGIDFYSREHEDAAQRPRLEITYAPPVSGTPSAAFTATPASGTFPLSVDFDASASTDDGQITTYAWDFGDGDTGSGEVTSHTYSAEGTYHATLTITDDQGLSDVATVAIDVADPQQPVVAAFQDGADPTSSYGGTRDTKIKSTSELTNFGALADIEVDGSPDYAALLRWDLSSLPAQSEIVAATIRLSVFNSTSDTYFLYELFRPWQELEASWNEFALGSPWQSAGALGGSDRGSTVLGTIEASSTGDVVVALNDAGLAVLQRWIEDPTTNAGFALLNYDDASDGFDFYSREHDDPAKRPRLEVTYSPPPPGSPQAVLTATPTSGTFPLTVEFDASASTDDGQIATYAWSFGDGDSGTGAVVDHVYSAAGTYHARLTITDDDGLSDVAIVEINVTDPQQPVLEAFQDGVYPTSSYAGTRDTKIKSDSEATNYGAVVEMEVDGTPDYGTLLRWDLSSLPSGAEVVAASIRLSVFNATSDTYYVYEMLRPWQEMEANWNEFAPGSPWESAGAQGVSDRGSEVLGTIEGTSTGDLVIELNAAGLAVVQGWIEDSTTNAGFVLMNYDGAGDGFDFYSREHEIPSRRPFLAVSYKPEAKNFDGLMANASATVDSESDEPLPDEFGVASVYPNPFNPRTTAVVDIAEAGSYALTVYNALGQQVMQADLTDAMPGTHEVSIDLSHLSSGVYFLVASNRTGARAVTKRLTLLK